MKIRVDQAAAPGTPQVGLDAVRIQSVDYLTRTITTAGVDANAVLDDTIYVVPAALFADLGTAFANGLRGLVDDGTYQQFIHGQDRTTVGNERLKSYVNANGGTLRDLTEQILIRTCHQVRDDVGKRLTDIWTGPGQLEKYIEFVAPDRRRAVEGGTYDKGTGYKDTGELVHYAPSVALRINNSFDIIPRELFLLCWDTWFHYVAQEMQWIDDDSMLHLAISSGGGGRAARWEAFMGSFENIGCDMPSANAVIRDLKDPAIGDV
jgi:hypothetical protein